MVKTIKIIYFMYSTFIEYMSEYLYISISFVVLWWHRQNEEGWMAC